MLVIKPYGRTRTGEDVLAGQPLRHRTLTLKKNREEGGGFFPPTPVSALGTSRPEFLMAHWISAIDKIARKPSGQKKASASLRRLRQTIADAAWSEMLTKGVLGVDDAARLAAVWAWKIHPYPKGDVPADKPQPGLKGQWYTLFAEDIEPEELTPYNAKAIAAKVYRHLHEKEARKGATKSDKQVGRIEAQIRSITSNVHAAPDAAILTDSPKWSDADLAAYFATRDVAAMIRAAGEKQVNRKVEKYGIIGKRRQLQRDLAGPILFAHYANLFVGKDNQPMKIKEARAEKPTLFSLHEVIKATYTKLLNRNKRDRAHLLPANGKDLVALINQQKDNRDLAALVRLGKVIHYEATASGDLDTPGNVISTWPMAIDASRYWTSDGQTEIKRNEALVRVWKSTIALSARTLTDWCGSNGDGDVLMAMPIAVATGAGFDAPAFDAKSKLLFGNRAGLFNGSPTVPKPEVLKFALEGWAQLRHNSFHFKGRLGFFMGLIDGVNKEISDSAMNMAVGQLWSDDQSERTSRLQAVMKSAQLEQFVTHDELQALFTSVENTKPGHSPLPRFGRVLHRAETTWRKAKPPLTLPPPYKREALEQPIQLCQYTALKLIYERVFPHWLDDRKADQINGWINRAADLATDTAQKLNKQELAESQMAGFGTLAKDEEFADFADRLAAESASEFRVQSGYASNAEQARRQSDFLNNLRCDVVALAFEQYLSESGFRWLLTMDMAQHLPDAPISDVTRLTSITGPAGQIEEWQKRLYFLIHLAPVDDISRLLHQLRKWQVLEVSDNVVSVYAKSIVEKVEAVMGLYLDMHDAKFEGREHLGVDDDFKSVFESEGDFNGLFRSPGEPINNRYVAVRGLREILRFGNFAPLKQVFRKYSIWHQDITELTWLEAKDDQGNSPIVAAQKQREALHAEWAKAKDKKAVLPEIDRSYRAALATVIDHRHRANHVRLNNHLQLHRLLMKVLGRLTDYAGLWERDLYFTALALVHLKGGDSVANCFELSGVAKLASGQIVDAIRASNLKDDLKHWFGHDYLTSNTGSVQIRNDMSHFNMLRGERVNLTVLVNRTRQMMRYDRKLKNAVSLSIIELLEREGLLLKWRNVGHDLAAATISIKQAAHLGGKSIVENLHGDIYGEMVAELFDGSFAHCDDVRRQLEPESAPLRTR